MDLVTIVVLCGAAFLGGFTQGLAGFGSTLVALPLLAMAMDMRLALPVCTTLAVGLNVALTSRLRLHIRKDALALLLCATIPGIPLGVSVLRAVPGHWLKGILALAILAFVFHSWRSGHGACPVTAPGRIWGVAAGFLAGCLGGAIGINGPPIVAWMCRQGYDRNALRGTLTAFFLLAGCGVVATQAVAGLVTPAVLWRAAVAVPALLAGMAAGMALCGRISEAAFQRVVLGLLALTGVVLLCQWGNGLAPA